MPKINILTEDLINKIAAGEVVERPASVVKELVENSLDAGATNIIVEIKDSGKQLIRVTDNGHGMDESDAKNSILRHATSKISNEEDLFSINTLGFRGEAMSSIAAVSQLSIITKQDQLEGFNLVVEGGEVVSSGIMAAEQGTAMEVRNLFFNTPARKNFLKTDAVELRHIIEVVTRYALINQNVSFKLLHEKHELLNSPAVQTLQDNIASIYGVSLAKDLLEVNFENESLKVTGFIAKPHEVRNDKNQQVLFVNNRWVRNEDVQRAIYEGYHSLLFVNKHPIYVLNIDIDPKKVDINVHPQKSEIKIEQKSIVCTAVMQAVKECLQKNNLIPIHDFEFENQMSVPKNSGAKYNFEKSQQQVLEVQEASTLYSGGTSADVVGSPADVQNRGEPTPERHSTSSLPEMKIFGQVHKTFFVAETPGGMFFIDQHAAHERVMYEQFMEQYMKSEVEIQSLLKGEVVEVSPAQRTVIDENINSLKNFGFSLDHFGENSYVLKTVPSIFGRLQPKELFDEVLREIQEEKNTVDSLKETIITRMACRSAVMAGEELTNHQMENIIQELSSKEFPYTCPHGRPTMIKMTADELEKKFKRKG